MNTAIITARIPASLKDDLENLAMIDGRKTSEIIRMALKDYVESISFNDEDDNAGPGIMM